MSVLITVAAHSTKSTYAVSLMRASTTAAPPPTTPVAFSASDGVGVISGISSPLPPWFPPYSAMNPFCP